MRFWTIEIGYLVNCKTSLTRELRACARASCRYDVWNGTHSLDWSTPVKFFFNFRLLSAFDGF